MNEWLFEDLIPAQEAIFTPAEARALARSKMADIDHLPQDKMLDMFFKQFATDHPEFKTTDAEWNEALTTFRWVQRLSQSGYYREGVDFCYYGIHGTRTQSPEFGEDGELIEIYTKIGNRYMWAEAGWIRDALKDQIKVPLLAFRAAKKDGAIKNPFGEIAYDWKKAEQQAAAAQ